MALDQKQLVEAMAESAHNAWWETYKALGYTSRKAAWGEEFMVPFYELSEQGKEFDRMIMRAILSRFTIEGFEVISRA
jgi:RyR domain